MTNTDLLRYLRQYYYQLKVCRGFIEALLPKTLSFIEIVDVDVKTDTFDLQYEVRALRLVSTWHVNVAGLAVVATLLSIVLSIVWTAVAVRVYDQDIQTSVQTGFTLGGYLITAEALVIAMVAYSASLYEMNIKEQREAESLAHNHSRRVSLQAPEAWSGGAM
ncbi:hypothetical protein SBRCBS47491_009107 [Sporothrix bragantina]|uniref:Uncharacterized protein n=1 Tax=Sporothrix bragantina TaxID=671064 RepID=A0ABP0CVB5_9PEZI